MKKLVFLIIACILMASCAPSEAQIQEAIEKTSVAAALLVTDTLVPTVTATDEPTSTPKPTRTPAPTRTPRPTRTTEPTPTEDLRMAYIEYASDKAQKCSDAMTELGDLSGMASRDADLMGNPDWQLLVRKALDEMNDTCASMSIITPPPGAGLEKSYEYLVLSDQEYLLASDAYWLGVTGPDIVKLREAADHMELANGYMGLATDTLPDDD